MPRYSGDRALLFLLQTRGPVFDFWQLLLMVVLRNVHDPNQETVLLIQIGKPCGGKTAWWVTASWGNRVVAKDGKKNMIVSLSPKTVDVAL
jgi:hypothetical protein